MTNPFTYSSPFGNPRTANFGRGQFGQFSPYLDTPQPSAQSGNASTQDGDDDEDGLGSTQRRTPPSLAAAIAPRVLSAPGANGPSSGGPVAKGPQVPYDPSAILDTPVPDAQAARGPQMPGEAPGGGGGVGIPYSPNQRTDNFPGMYVPKSGGSPGGGAGTDGTGGGFDTSGSSADAASALSQAISPSDPLAAKYAQALGVDMSNPFWQQILQQLLHGSASGSVYGASRKGGAAFL